MHMQSITIPTDKANVCLVGRHPLAAKYLLNILDSSSDIQVHWMDAQLLPGCEFCAHQVLVLDSEGLDVPAGQYVHALKERTPALKCIVVDHPLDSYEACQLLRAGADGVLAYDELQDSLLLAIKSVRSGAMWVAPHVLQKYMRVYHRSKPDKVTHSTSALTTREQEILYFARQRFSNREIASLLNIEVCTVKFHLSNIFSKLNIARRSDLWERKCALEFPAANEQGESEGIWKVAVGGGR
jgi:DNA-binding NarL/FixJ family response regulator